MASGIALNVINVSLLSATSYNAIAIVPREVIIARKEVKKGQSSALIKRLCLFCRFPGYRMTIRFIGHVRSCLHSVQDSRYFCNYISPGIPVDKTFFLI